MVWLQVYSAGRAEPYPGCIGYRPSKMLGEIRRIEAAAAKLAEVCPRTAYHLHRVAGASRDGPGWRAGTSERPCRRSNDHPAKSNETLALGGSCLAARGVVRGAHVTVV